MTMANLINSKDTLQNSMYIIFWKIKYINVYMFVDLCENIKNNNAW